MTIYTLVMQVLPASLTLSEAADRKLVAGTLPIIAAPLDEGSDMSPLDARFARSAHLNQVCVGILAKKSLDSLTDSRDRLTVKATDYVAELHRSQLLLLNDQHYGAAAAMMRLVMEGALSALYILHLKDEAHAIQLEDGRTFLPSAGKMFARCSRLPIIGANIETIGRSQGPFHKFTHGDMPQINRRHSPSDWTGTFDEREIATFSIIADFVLLGAMDTYSHAIADLVLQKAIRGVRDENGAEAKAFGMPIPEDDTLSPPPIRAGSGGPTRAPRPTVLKPASEQVEPES